MGTFFWFLVWGIGKTKNSLADLLVLRNVVGPQNSVSA